MTRFSRMLLFALVLILCALAPIAHAQNPVPSQMTAALQTLSNLLGVPVALNDLDQYNWEQNVYADTTLGCGFVVFPPTPQPTVGYAFELTYNGITYDIRVSGDQSINFACMPSDGGQPIPGVATIPVGGLPETSLSPCPATYDGYLIPHLRIGGEGHIEAGGTPNRLRDAPSLHAAQIGMIQPGSTVTVLAGPSCEPISVNGQANIVFWQVRAGGQVGWTAEGLPPNDYFIEAVGGAGLPSERALIAPENGANLTMLNSIPLEGVRDLDISPLAANGNGLLAAVGFSQYGFYNLLNLAPVNVITANISYTNATSVALSPDGRYVAFGFCSVINLIDTQTSAGYGFTLPANACVGDLEFNHTGTLLAAGIGTTKADGTPGTGTFALIDPTNAQQASAITSTATAFSVTDVAFSPDNATVAYISDQVHLVSTATRGEIGTIALEAPNPVGAVAYVPVQTGSTALLAFGDGNGVRVMNTLTAQEAFYEIEPNSHPVSIAFTPDARLMAVTMQASGPDGWDALFVFDVETGDTVMEAPLDNRISTTAFSPDGTLLLLSAGDEVLVLGIP